MSEPEPQNVAADIARLYELSLSVGQSLDLQADCDGFLRTLMARKNLGYASVWIDETLLQSPEPDSAPVGAEGGNLKLVYANPQSRPATDQIPPDHPLLRELGERDALSVAAADPGFAALLTERDVHQGAFLVFRLGRIGLLKLLATNRTHAFPETEINQLRNVVAKFTVSLEGCLAHRRLRREAEERQRAENRLRRVNESFLQFSPDPIQNIQRLTALCGELIGGTCALYNRLDSDLLCMVGRWQAPPDLPLLDRAEGQICHDVLAHSPERIVVIRNLSSSAYRLTSPLVNRHGLQTYCGRTVSFDGQPRGVLAVLFAGDFEPGPGDRKLLSFCAAAIGIEEERLVAQTRLLTRLRYEKGLAACARALFEAGDLHEALRHLREAALACRVLLVENIRDAARGLCTRVVCDAGTTLAGDQPAPEFTPLPAAWSAHYEHWRAELSAGRWICARAGEFGPEEQARLAAHSVRTALILPIFAGDAWFGSLIFAHPDPAFEWSEDDVRLLQTGAGLIGTYLERRQAAAALAQSEDKYRNVVERANDGILIIQDGVVKFANRALVRLTGFSLEQALGVSFLDFIAPDERARVGERYQRRMAGETVPPVYETVIMRPDGTRFEVEVNAGLTTYADRPADLVFVRDVTERRKTERERARLAMAVEQTADAVLITDQNGDILYVNPAFERITGYGRHEVLGRNPRLLKSGRQTPAVYRELWTTIQAGRTWQGRFINRRKDGAAVTCDTTITPILDEGGAIISFVGVQRDVTRELEIEQQYYQAQKTESVGRLAGGIAHDFNNIMTSILGFATLAMDGLDYSHPIRENLKVIVKEGERAANLTRQLLAYSRRQMMDIRPLDINALLLDMQTLLHRLLGEDIELVIQTDERAGRVLADLTLLKQVIMNLVVNARDAMPRGGRLSIRTAHVTLDPAFCAGRKSLKPGDYVLLTVRDTGAGMTAEVKAHIFEPFFTTKPVGQGTGLGLASVYGIVQQFKGAIDFQSEPGAGTLFMVWLPRDTAANQTGPIEAPAAAPPITGGRETILVAEDEDVLRRFVCRILRDLGYTVLEADNGLTAVEVAARCASPIDLLVTDVVMPKMSGPELARRLAAERPPFKVIYMSGFTETAIAEHGIVPGDVTLIQKPFSHEQLATLVRQKLDEETP